MGEWVHSHPYSTLHSITRFSGFGFSFLALWVIFNGMTHLPMFEKDCRLFAALTSFLLTVLLGWDALINPDGILYVLQAQLFNDGAWRQGAALYPWPTFSLLIAAVHKLGPSYEHSAIFINGCFYGLMVAGFVTLIKFAGGNRTLQWIAAIVLLVHPDINGYRHYIIRDPGLWGMLFWSVYALYRYHETRAWRYVFLWTLTIGTAFLFRVESIVFLAFAPMGLLLFAPRRSFVDYLRVQSLFITAALCLIACVIYYADQIDLGRLEELPRHLDYFLHIGTHYMDRAEKLAMALSDEMKPKHAVYALLGAAIAYLLLFVVKGVTVFYAALIGVTAHYRLFPTSLVQRYITLFIALSAMFITLFFFELYFLSGRYVVPLVLLLLCFVPHAIHSIALARNNGTFLGQPWILPSIMLFMIAMFISGVTSFGYSKEYLRESGQWIHAHVKPNATLFVSDKHVAYYAQRYDAVEVLDHRTEAALKEAMKHAFAGKDVIALYHTRKTRDINAYLESHFSDKQRIQFENKRHDGVTIIILNPEALIKK